MTISDKQLYIPSDNIQQQPASADGAETLVLADAMRLQAEGRKEIFSSLAANF